MKVKKEHMWQAYIDGELSATEMSAFEESLSASERRLLSGDVQFDRALSDRLAEDTQCPDDVWARTKALLEASASEHEDATPEKVVPFTPSRYRNIAMIVAAAMVTLMVSWVLPSITGNSLAPVILAEESVDELAARSEVDPTREDIQRYMQNNNYKIVLVPVNTMRIVKVHSGVRLLGASRSKNGKVAELFFECCHQPVKIILAERNTSEARAIGQAMGEDNDLQAVRGVGNYVAGVVSKHPSYGLLDIFAGQHP